MSNSQNEKDYYSQVSQCSCCGRKITVNGAEIVRNCQCYLHKGDPCYACAKFCCKCVKYKPKGELNED